MVCFSLSDFKLSFFPSAMTYSRQELGAHGEKSVSCPLGVTWLHFYSTEVLHVFSLCSEILSCLMQKC